MKTEEELIWEKYTDKEKFGVTIEFGDKEDADRFKQFMSNISDLCNAGSSRVLIIDEPSSDEEREMRWDFDGDGDTRIFVK